MSDNYMAITVIGIPISQRLLEKTEILKGCQKGKTYNSKDKKCPETVDTSFCPICGKEPNPIVTTKFVDDFEFPDGIYFAETHRGLDGPIFVGFVSEGATTDMKLPVQVDIVPDINELKTKLQAFLEPLKAWDEKSFGLYTLLFAADD